MPKATSQTERTRSIKTTISPESDQFSNGFASNAALTAAPAQMMSRLMVTGQEMSRFATARLRKDVGVMSALATCRSPQEFSETWVNHVSEAVHDYADEFDRVMSISLDAVDQRSDG